MIYAAAYENQPITPMNCHIIEPSTMSHGDWQSWEVFMTIMVIIMSHNRIKLFHCFADGGRPQLSTTCTSMHVRPEKMLTHIQ